MLNVNEKVWTIMDDANEKFLATLVTTETPVIGMGIKFSSENIYNIVDVVYVTSTCIKPLEEAVDNTNPKYENYIKDKYDSNTSAAMYYVAVRERE